MVRYTDWERSTSNAERSTFKGLTESAHGGRDMGTETEFGRPDFWPGGRDQEPAGRSKPAVVHGYGDRHDVWGPPEQIEGQARCPIYRSGPFNV